MNFGGFVPHRGLCSCCKRGIPAFLICLICIGNQHDSLPVLQMKGTDQTFSSLRFSATLHILYFADFKILQSGMSGLFLTCWIQNPYLISIQASSQSCFVEMPELQKVALTQLKYLKQSCNFINTPKKKKVILSNKRYFYQISDRIKIENGGVQNQEIALKKCPAICCL